MNKQANHSHTRLILFVTITLQMLGYGCATSPASHFYLLDIVDEQSSNRRPASALTEKSIGIGPIRLPEYLDRPHIVTRSDNTELYISDIHRWAEPLHLNFTRVLAEQISIMLGTENISIEPSRNRNDLDLRIHADVIQFDANRNGAITLIAYWGIENKDGANLVNIRKSTIRLDTSRSPDYDEIVEGLSLSVYRLAREITTELSRD